MLVGRGLPFAFVHLLGVIVGLGLRISDKMDQLLEMVEMFDINIKIVCLNQHVSIVESNFHKDYLSISF